MPISTAASSGPDLRRVFQSNTDWQLQHRSSGAVEIRVAVKLHDIGFGVFLFQFGSQQDFHDLAGKGALLGQICIFDHLLGNGTAALSHFPAMLDQGKTGPEGGNPVYAVMVLNLRSSWAI